MLGRAAAGTGGRFHAFIGQGGVIVVEKIATLNLNSASYNSNTEQQSSKNQLI